MDTTVTEAKIISDQSESPLLKKLMTIKYWHFFTGDTVDQVASGSHAPGLSEQEPAETNKKSLPAPAPATAFMGPNDRLSTAASTVSNVNYKNIQLKTQVSKKCWLIPVTKNN